MNILYLSFDDNPNSFSYCILQQHYEDVVFAQRDEHDLKNNFHDIIVFDLQNSTSPTKDDLSLIQQACCKQKIVIRSHEMRENSAIQALAEISHTVVDESDLKSLIQSIDNVDKSNNPEESKSPKELSNNTIVLISPKGWQKVSVNLGLALLAAALQRAGFEVVVFDLCYRPLDDEHLMTRLEKLNPFLLGFSVKTAQAKESFRLAELVKNRLPETTLVAGGPHVTLDPEFFFTYKENIFSYCIMSEGEVALTSLAISLWNNNFSDVKRLQGVVLKSIEDDRIQVNDWEPPKNISALPYPAFKSIDGFSSDGFCYPIVSSRGCPYQCIYCCVKLLAGSRRWRARKPEEIVKEIIHAKNEYGISQFEFWDDNFTLDVKRAKTFCKLLIEEQLNLSWWCHNGIRADKIDQELADLMFQAGCTSVAFGIESGTEDVFNSIRKGESLDDCVKAVGYLKNAGIKAVGYFIIGLPADNLISFIDTVKFQRRLNLDHFTFGLLVPYPGTEVYDIIQNEGEIIKDAIDTQHFSSDIPEITFELPNYSRQDILISYYLTKYFELYTAVEDVLARNENCSLLFGIIENNVNTIFSGLLYAVLLFRDRINLSVVYKGDMDKLRRNEVYKEFKDDFRGGGIKFSSDFNANVKTEKIDIILYERTYEGLFASIENGEKFVLQAENPIKSIISREEALGI